MIAKTHDGNETETTEQVHLIRAEGLVVLFTDDCAAYIQHHASLEFHRASDATRPTRAPSAAMNPSVSARTDVCVYSYNIIQ